MTSSTHTDERQAIADALTGHLARQRAARILDEQRAERQALRAARADAAAERAGSDAMTLASSRPDTAALAARRRDEYKRALAYPMQPAEVLAAVRTAVTSCGLRPDTDEQARDTVGIVVCAVIAKHGRNPLRCDVGWEWLRERVRRTYDRESFRHERATGQRQSAALARQWTQDDDSATYGAGADAVWQLAAGTPAPEQDEPLDAADVARRLRLTSRQADALTLALDSTQRVTAALTGAERKAAADARAMLRRTYPDAAALRYALRPRRAVLAAVDAAIAQTRQSAEQAGHGSHLPGRTLAMAEHLRPILRQGQRLTQADRVWTYGLTARDDRAARNDSAANLV